MEVAVPEPVPPSLARQPHPLGAVRGGDLLHLPDAGCPILGPEVLPLALHTIAGRSRPERLADGAGLEPAVTWVTARGLTG